MHKTSAALSWRSAKDRFSLAANQTKGKIESITCVRIGPKSFENQAPYVIAMIRLDNGQNVISQVIDLNAKIGDKVEACIRRQYTNGQSGIIEYGTKFKVIK